MEPAPGPGLDVLDTPSPLLGLSASPVGLEGYQLHASHPIRDPITGQTHILTFPLAKWDALGVALGDNPSGPFNSS